MTSKISEEMVSAIIVAVVVVIVFSLLFVAFRYGGSFIDNISLNPNKTLAVDQELVRYSLDDGSVAYYTGSEWVALDSQKEVTLNNKRLSGKQLQLDFTSNFYFGKGVREDSTLDIAAPSSSEVTSAQPTTSSYPVSIVFTSVSRNVQESQRDLYGLVYVSAGVYSRGLIENPTPLGTYTIAYNGLVYYQETGKDEQRKPMNDYYRAISNAALEWRDSILQDHSQAKPIVIHYIDLDQNRASSSEVYLKKTGDYLIATLS